METQIELPKGVREAIFSLEGLHAAAAEVSVNGMVCGDLCWAPYEVKLTGLHPGRNLLKIRLFGTLRNLLGPWHRPVGEIGAVWPGGYDSPNEPWEGSFSLETGKADPKWYLDRVPDKPGWTESYLCVPWGIVRPVVCWSVTTGEQTKAK